MTRLAHSFQGSAGRIATIGFAYSCDAIVGFNFDDCAQAQGACRPYELRRGGSAMAMECSFRAGDLHLAKGVIVSSRVKQ